MGTTIAASGDVWEATVWGMSIHRKRAAGQDVGPSPDVA
jgi:hypothetical protein